MSRRWSCTVICDYCKAEQKTIGQIPRNWKIAQKDYVDDHSGMPDKDEFHCCERPECIQSFKEHIETEGLREVENI